MTNGNDGDFLKITNSQHNNSGESSSSNASSIWQQLFPQSSQANDDADFKAWSERVYGLALQKA
eukprot:10584076-Karenia_brevis.AAC.1